MKRYYIEYPQDKVGFIVSDRENDKLGLFVFHYVDAEMIVDQLNKKQDETNN
jgi:hypothetical protein